MKYPLPTMTLNDKYCKHIMWTIVKFGLTKDGISSTCHAAVRYGIALLETLDSLTLLWFNIQAT